MHAASGGPPGPEPAEVPGLDALFEDLEQQAEGIRLTDRDAEIADRSRSEYAGVPFVSRLHASLGRPVGFVVRGVGVLQGGLRRVGPDWALVSGGATPSAWVVRLEAVLRADGLAEGAVGEAARPVVSRLGLGSVLRGIAESRNPVLVGHVDGSQRQGYLGRVGADFVELAPEDGAVARRVEVVPFAGVAAVRLVDTSLSRH